MKKYNLNKKNIEMLERYGLKELNQEEIQVFEYEDGEFVFRQEEELKYLSLLIEGRAKVFHTNENGKTLLIDIYNCEGITGEVEMMTGEKNAALSVQVIARASMIAIPLKRYKNELMNNVEFMNHAGIAMGDKLLRSNAYFVFSMLNDIKTRLCSFIYHTSVNGVFREKLTETAEALGTSYRHLLRTLNVLCEEKIIIKTLYGYKINNEKTLMRVGKI